MPVNISHTDVPESIVETNEKKGVTKKPACPNCGYTFGEIDNWCPNCGQANRTHKRPVQYFVREFFEELVNLDARFFSTFRDLIIKPGLLTKNYNADLRVRYTSPLRFYVISSVLVFLSITWMTKASIQEADSQLHSAYEENDSLLTDLDITLGPNVDLGPEDLQALADLEVHTHHTVDSLLTARGIEAGWINTRIVLGITPLLTGEFSITQYFQRLVRNFSYSLFFFMPVFALLLKIVYVRRHQFYTEHLIFAIHFHTFTFIITFLFLWIDYFQDWFLFSALLSLGIPLYMLVAMKVVYEQGWIKTMIKATVVFWAYVFLTLFGFVFLTLFSLLQV